MNAVLALSLPVDGSIMPVVVAVIVALAVLGGAVALIFALAPDKTKTLQAQLGDYGPETEEVPTGAHQTSLVESGVVQSAVEITEKIGTRYGLVEKIEHKLEQADLPVRASEALFFYVAGLVLLLVIASFATANVIMGLIVTAFAAAVPIVILNQRQRKRLRKFEEMLPDTLGLLAGTLRAGFSFMQGLEAVSNETSEPMRRELQRAFTEAKLGVPVEDALNDVADRMDSEDLRWAVLAISIQREVGGNLAELLDTVASTMVQRDRLRAEIRALTAEGRISAIILGIFPFAMAGVLYVMNPTYIATLWEDPLGLALLIGTLMLSGAGMFWLKKTVTIEV